MTASASQNCANCEKASKVQRKGKGCIGTCIAERALYPHSKDDSSVDELRGEVTARERFAFERVIGVSGK